MTRKPSSSWDATQMNPEAAIEAERKNLTGLTVRPSRVHREKGRLYFPQELIPEGMVYAWMAERMGNQDTADLVDEKYSDGWRFVRYSDHPELLLDDRDLEFSRYKNDDRIRRRGMILMKLPLDVHKEDQDYYMVKAMETRQQADYLDTNFKGDRNSFYTEDNKLGYESQHKVQQRGSWS